jgi:hypothetical protein
MKFKCILNDSVYEFTQPVDIEAMLVHPQYVVVEDEIKEEIKAKPTKAK